MATATARTASAFRSSAFSRFYAGQALSYLGDGLRRLAIPLLVFRLTGSATAVGLTWGLELLPFAIVSLVGGSLADRVDRRRTMLACDGLRFAVMTLLCVLFATGHLTVAIVYGAVIVLSVGGALFLASQTPSIRYVLGADGVRGGVAALHATEQTVNLVAPPLGGALMGVVGPLPALAINAFTYLWSQFAIASVRTFGPDAPGRIPKPHEVAADVKDGWRLLMADRTMRITTFCSLGFNTIGSIGFVVLIPFFKRAFAASDAAIGVAFGGFAAGAAIGSFVAGRTHWPVGRALIIANLFDAVLWIAPPWLHSMSLAVVAFALASIASGYYMTTIVSWRMRVMPEDAVGRVFGVVRLLAMVGALPGAIAGGWIADHVGVRQAVAVSGIGYLMISFVLAFSAVREETR
ncbi:MAG TPA: MFS transporter [Candidatus Elarobacter sp.]|jgi:MFS family permease|nr:MFS transporter [Candidatus Elarobacter sp.]